MLNLSDSRDPAFSISTQQLCRVIDTVCREIPITCCGSSSYCDFLLTNELSEFQEIRIMSHSSIDYEEYCYVVHELLKSKYGISILKSQINQVPQVHRR